MMALVMMCALSVPAYAAQPKVGIVQLADNGAFTDMREGFQARMAELGYDAVYDEKNAQGDMSNLYAICQHMADVQMDLVVTIATPPTQAMVNLETGIPVFFISVSNPVGAGVLTDMAAPDKLATGTSNAIPVEEMFKLSALLTPQVQSYGILYNTSEINAATTAKNAMAYLDAQGLSYQEAVVTASSEVQQAAQALVDAGMDALFIPNDSMVQSALPLVAEIAKEAKIPVYGSSAVMVASGAFATISISDREIGAMTADMAHQYLQGTPIAEIPAVTVSKFTTVINQTTAAAIGVTLPADALTNAVLLH
ncbi:MAG: ABC transporter substrate-binding protein [Clostridia bacterium]